MRARELTDRAEFCRAIERVAPQVWAGLPNVAARSRNAGKEWWRDEVVAYLRGFHLDGLEWLVDAAYLESKSERPGCPMPSGGVVREVFELAWELGDSGETPQDFRERAMHELETFIARVEESATFPSQERNGGRAPRGLRRWDPLVRRLVLGESFEAIAEDFGSDGIGVSWQAARKRVLELAARLGVTLSNAT